MNDAHVLDAVILIALGLVLAFAGKRFIWLLVAAAGFIIAYKPITWLIPGDALLEVIIGVIAGLVLAWLATRFVKLMLNVAGFILLGGLAVVVAQWFGFDSIPIGLVAFAAGGLIALALFRFAFNLGLALVAALGGAAMVGDGLRTLLTTQSWSPWLIALVTVIVAVGGFMFQRNMGPFRRRTAVPAR
jgi:hypothetical protein